MGKFDEYLDQEAQEIQYEELELSLMCDRCGKPSTKVRYLEVKGIMAWKCPDGHKNLMEGFYFG